MDLDKPFTSDDLAKILEYPRPPKSFDVTRGFKTRPTLLALDRADYLGNKNFIMDDAAQIAKLADKLQPYQKCIPDFDGFIKHAHNTSVGVQHNNHTMAMLVLHEHKNSSATGLAKVISGLKQDVRVPEPARIVNLDIAIRALANTLRLEIDRTDPKPLLAIDMQYFLAARMAMRLFEREGDVKTSSLYLAARTIRPLTLADDGPDQKFGFHAFGRFNKEQISSAMRLIRLRMKALRAGITLKPEDENFLSRPDISTLHDSQWPRRLADISSDLKAKTGFDTPAELLKWSEAYMRTYMGNSAARAMATRLTTFLGPDWNKEKNLEFQMPDFINGMGLYLSNRVTAALRGLSPQLFTPPASATRPVDAMTLDPKRKHFN